MGDTPEALFERLFGSAQRVLIPWSFLQPSTRGQWLIAMSEAQLKHQPQFVPASRPDLGNYQLANDMIGHGVVSQDGQQVGKVKDVVFTRNGQAQLILIGKGGGFLGFGGGDVVPVPWAKVRPLTGTKYEVTASAARLKQARAFARDRLPDWNEPGIGEQIADFFTGGGEQQPATKPHPSRRTATARAPAPSTPPKDRFAHLDTAGDGLLSRREVLDHIALSRAFDSLDGDQNGELDRAEFARLQQR